GLVVILLCLSIGAPAFQDPARLLFPVVIRFINRMLGRKPTTVKGTLEPKKKPGITLDIPDLQVVPTKEPCNNWTWAASVELLLPREKIPFRQMDLVDKAEGGSLCKDQSPDFARMSHAINGEYYLDSGLKYRLEARNVTGAPTVVDDILVSMRDGHPL